MHSEVAVPAREPSPAHPRLRGAGRFGLSAFLCGLSLVVVVDATGLLNLLGDPRAEVELLGGLIVGALLFPVLGAVMAQRLPRPLLWSTIVAVVGVAVLAELDAAYPVITPTDLFARSILVAVAGTPVAVVGLPAWGRVRSSRKAYGWAMALAVGPIVMAVVDSLIYASLGFGGFPYIVLVTEALAAGLLLLAFALARRKARSSRGGSDFSGPGRESEEGGPARPGARAVGDPGSEGARSQASSAWVPSSSMRSVVKSIGSLPPKRPRASEGLAALALAVILLATLPGSIPTSAPAISYRSPAHLGLSATTRTPIQHLVIIMLENHAYDNYFGMYPFLTSNGETMGLAPEVTVPNGLENASDHWDCASSQVPPSGCSPQGLSVVPNGTWTTGDPLEGYSPYHIDWDQGRMDGWLSPGGSGTNALTTFTADQMAPEWDLAEEYAFGDAYYASVMTESNPNHLYSYAGYSPVTNDYGPPPYLPLDQTIFGELSSFGVSWGYYVDNPQQGIGVLHDIAGLSPNAAQIGSWGNLESSVTSGTLPAVSWLRPVDGGAPAGISQGPGSDMLWGEMWLLYWVNLLMESPEWNSTALVITYDEGGGFYDHVAPPSLDGVQQGERVPLIVVSPYAKEDYVSHTVMNHASWLAFVDYNWGLPALNAFVADSSLPLDLFDLGNSPRAPYPFSASEGFPAPTALHFELPANPVLAPLFPRALQENPSSLPYGRTGSST
ncbi:MAG: alkaline phosphatase family protein, partial [Euryarchaeota archaeon]|nr:alkaline phosphatase family protein [Euryarchaeota archaeon]